MTTFKNTLSYYLYPVFWISLVVLSFYLLESTLTPLIGAFFLAYLLYPIVEKLQSFGLSKAWAVGITYTVSCVILTGLIVMLTPMLVHLAITFIKDLPRLLTSATYSLEQVADQFGIPFHFEVDIFLNEMQHYLTSISFSTFASFSNFLKNTVFNVIHIFLWFVKFLFFPVFFYYTLDKYQDIKQQFTSFIPYRFRPYLSEFSEIVSRVLSGYIRGQLLVCSILATFYACGFWLVGMHFGVIIGVITGFLYIIPYVGFTIALIMGIVITLANFSGIDHLLLVLLIYMLGQALESFFLTPKITGNKVGLDPFLTILVLIAGGNLFGFVGMLTAIPIAGIMKQYYGRIKTHYQTSEFFIKDV